MDPAADHLTARLRGLRDHLAAIGAIRSPAVARAFATVRRDRCVPTVLDEEGMVAVPQDGVPAPELLDLIYADRSLVIRLDPATGGPSSSSSQPSLVARMIEALEPAPGHAVCEVGAGSGYHAALIGTATGGPVVTVDADPAVAADARAAIGRLGLTEQVTVVAGDGFDGYAEGAPYHRVAVTCGCTGLSPRWLEQLTGDGPLVVPLAHGGVHPVVAVRRSGRPALTGRAVMWADFMPASGRLGADRAPLLTGLPPGTSASRHAGVGPALQWHAYADLWFFLAARDPRVTRLAAAPPGVDPALGLCAVHVPGRGVAVAQMDGAVVTAGDPVLLGEVAELITQWDAAGRPSIGRWTCEFTAPDPVLRPVGWRLDGS